MDFVFDVVKYILTNLPVDNIECLCLRQTQYHRHGMELLSSS